MRTQIYITERVVGRGELPSTPTIADLSNDVVERLIPRLIEMQQALAEILTAQAQTARLWRLTQPREAQADRVASTDRCSPDAQPARAGQGKKPNAEDPTEGVVPLTMRGRRG